MKIGILCAGDREAAPFFPWIEHCHIREKAMLKIHEGLIENTEVAVLFSGVCKVNAAIAAQVLIDTFGCDAIINCGTAGAMDERLKVFDTVISTEAAYHDVAEGALTRFHPWLESACFKADEALVHLAAKSAGGIHHPGSIYLGRMMTGEQFIEKDACDQINRRYAPLCVDMETASVAHVCYVNRIPFVAVRTMTDVPRDGDEAAFEANCDRASQLSAEIVWQMLRCVGEKGLDR